MSRKWFIPLTTAAIIGWVVVVSASNGPQATLAYDGTTYHISATLSPTTGSGELLQADITTLAPTPQTGPVIAQTTIVQDQSNVSAKSLPPGSVSIQVNFSRFENTEHGISIIYPSNWEIDNEDDDNDGTIDIAGFLSPFDDRFDTYKERLWLSLDTPSNPNMSLSDYSSEIVRQDNETMQDFQLLDIDADSFVLDGYPAYRYINKWTANDGTIIKQLEIGTKIGDKVYYIDYYAEENRYTSFLPIIQEMINSFKFGR